MLRQPVNPDHFIAALERQLRALGEPFSPAAVREFVHDHWQRILDQPDVGRWTWQFLDEPPPGETDVGEPDETTSPSTTYPERKTRSLVWIVGLAALGLLFGAVAGSAWYLRDAGTHGGVQGALLSGLSEGAVAGAIVGGIAGAVVWAFFPYQPNTRSERQGANGPGAGAM